MRALLILALALPVLALAQTKPLNDTGITWSGHATSGGATICDPAHPAGQDCHYGRDAQAATGTLTKIGGGNAGFDFTALNASGQPTTTSSGPNPHHCVRDNVTGLVWEVKTDDGGLHDKDWTFTWYDSVHNYYGSPGTPSGGICGGTVPVGCDTEKFVAAVNASGWCGFNDWRMPKLKELEDIIDHGRLSPSIDTTYFPNTPNSYFWSGSPSAGLTHGVWYVVFGLGTTDYGYHYYNLHLRLVRGGQ